MKLLDRVREALRVRRRSPNTEKAYIAWIVRYIRYHKLRHPQEMGEKEVTEFLTWLAVERKVSASTQNQAMNALAFLYHQVLEKPMGNVDAIKGNRTRRLPVVMATSEVEELLLQMRGQPALAAHMMYGCGLRVAEACELRVQDVELERDQITVRGGKGDRDRVVMLPRSVRGDLQRQIARRERIHEQDMAAGGGYVPLPGAFALKSPSSPRKLGWQFLFMARRQITDRDTGRLFRPPLHRSSVQRAVKVAASRAGLVKRVSSHTLRHSFATHMLEAGIDIRTVQKLLGHRSVQTTMVYLHVCEQNFPGITSPLDRLHSRRSSHAAPGSPAAPPPDDVDLGAELDIDVE